MDAATKKLATSLQVKANTNAKAQNKVAKALSPKVPVGKTKHNQPALNKNQLIETRFGSSPASVAGLGNPS